MTALYEEMQGIYNSRWRYRALHFGLCSVIMFFMFVLLMNIFSGIYSAESFTDIFYTNSFRGSFEWIQKLDWVGKVIQIVISVFSLFGIALMTIRILTSMLYLSSKGLWEEVSELKETPSGDSAFDVFGVLGMTKSWLKGKSGTGLDAIMGAILILLPDVKKYSDFGKHANGKFDSDLNISQYMLKIALPTVLCTFFFAMGFNGTLFKALAVSVDFLGAFADQAVSVDYAGYVEDLVNSGTGYKFTFDMDGTDQGKLKQSLAKDIYGKVISKGEGLTSSQLYAIGQNIESQVADMQPTDTLVSSAVQELAGTDRYWKYMGFETIVNTSPTANNASADVSIGDVLSTSAGLGGGDEMYVHVFIKQVTSVDGSYFNVDEVA